MAEKVMDCM